MLTHMPPPAIRLPQTSFPNFGLYGCRVRWPVRQFPAGPQSDSHGPPSAVSGLPSLEPPSAQSPFARLGSYLRRRDVQHLVRGRYPSFIAPTGSCVEPNSSPRLRSSYSGRSLQVAVSPCWKLALPDVISAICVKVLGPVPRSVPSGHCPFRTRKGIGLTADAHGSARQKFPTMQLLPGDDYEAAVIP
jgi:hypothetical protein